MGIGTPVVLLDVNETLSDMSPIAGRFEDLGAPRHLAPLWFTRVLRDGFALTAAGASRGFAQIADGVLRQMLAGSALDRDIDAAVVHVLQGFATLPVHPDVPAGIASLARAGYRLVTLSNGASEVAEGLLTRAGLREHVEAFLSVEDAGAWKPDARAYLYAAEACGVAPSEMTLVAAHPWDIDGAWRAGLRTAWIDRPGLPYPAHFAEPDTVARSFEDLATAAGDD